MDKISKDRLRKGNATRQHSGHLSLAERAALEQDADKARAKAAKKYARNAKGLDAYGLASSKK